MTDYQLATRDAQALAGTSTLGNEDMVIPRLRLVQSQSEFSDEVGALFNNLTGEASPAVRAVVLKVGKNRVMWPPDFQRDQQPLCASNDAFAPRDGYVGKYATLCSDCPHAQWGEDGKPPACSFGYTYLIADRDVDDLPAMLTASRTSLKAAKQANTLIRAFGVRREIIIGTKAVVSKQGKYHILAFTLGDSVEPEAIAKYADMSQSLGGTVLGADTGDESTSSPDPSEGFTEEDYERGQYTEAEMQPEESAESALFDSAPPEVAAILADTSPEPSAPIHPSPDTLEALEYTLDKNSPQGYPWHKREQLIERLSNHEYWKGFVSKSTPHLALPLRLAAILHQATTQGKIAPTMLDAEVYQYMNDLANRLADQAAAG